MDRHYCKFCNRRFVSFVIDIILMFVIDSVVAL